jgi:hypothetical protein
LQKLQGSGRRHIHFSHLLLIAGCEPLPSAVRLRDSHFVVGFPRTLIRPSHSCRDWSSGEERWSILRHGANKTGWKSIFDLRWRHNSRNNAEIASLNFEMNETVRHNHICAYLLFGFCKPLRRGRCPLTILRPLVVFPGGPGLPADYKKIWSWQRNVRSDHKQAFALQNGMPSLPAKADMCGAIWGCPLWAKSGHILFDYFVGAPD